jgi:hypothetical protein
VATDVFGSGYVIPMQNIVANIEARPGVVSVELPGEVDLLMAEFEDARLELGWRSVGTNTAERSARDFVVDSGYNSRFSSAQSTLTGISETLKKTREN